MENSGRVADATDGGDAAEGSAPPSDAAAGPSLLDRLTAPVRLATGFFSQRAVARAARAVPRTVHFVTGALIHGEVADSVPAPRVSLGLAAQVAVDEVLVAVAMAPRRLPTHDDFHRVSVELAESDAMYGPRGWIDDPATYHRTPPPLTEDEVTSSHGWAMGLGYRRLYWDSGFAPHPGEPGGERWMAFEANRTASAVVVSHDDGPRPWVIAVHGFCMGFPFMDFRGLNVARMHREVGMNVAVATLPLHGSRRSTFISGEPFLSFELMNAVHGLTQTAWDIRRLIHWVAEQGATSITLYGVSLGAYAAALLAGLDDRFDAVVAGVPVSDFPGLFHHHSPQHVRARAIEHEVMGSAAENVFRVVSPFSFEPKVPQERRYIFAGYGDRLALPEQAQQLWEHWDRPRISWYSGNHVGYLWSRKVSNFLADSLTDVATSGAALSCRG